MDYSEKRRFVRLDINTKLDFQINEVGGEQVLAESNSGIVKNLSVEGICFSSNKQLKAGSKIELSIALPGGPKPVAIRGEVVWSRPIEENKGAKNIFDTGVKLINVAQGDENRFLIYMCDKMTEQLNKYLKD
jgi:hypothetical protein